MMRKRNRKSGNATGFRYADEKGIHLEIENSEEFIPEFISSFSTRINSINLRRPTLDDVFMKLTGHEIRKEEASAKDRMKSQMRMRGH